MTTPRYRNRPRTYTGRYGIDGGTTALLYVGVVLELQNNTMDDTELTQKPADRDGPEIVVRNGTEPDARLTAHS